MWTSEEGRKEGIEDEERTSDKMRVNCRRGGEEEGGVAKVNNLTGFERERERRIEFQRRLV